jgi:hypothetical protein
VINFLYFQQKLKIFNQMDYAEEQAGEIEALKSIYEGDLEGL